MSTGLIIVIAVVVVILLVLLALAPRMRERARVKKGERELGRRREGRAAEHREVADTRNERAEAAEQRARVAQQEAERERAEADLHRERATASERGLADHELIGDDERDRFAGTSAETNTDEDREATRRG
jgi:FtsZ-interacting cell division protein ZipA